MPKHAPHCLFAHFKCSCESQRLLQDAVVTNAGRGSNLTEEGTVECDASVMAGDGAFGGVGAAPGATLPTMRLCKYVALKAPCLQSGRAAHA